MDSSFKPAPSHRRQALGALGAVGALTALALAACGGGDSTASNNAALAGLSLSVAGLSPALVVGVNTLSIVVTAADGSSTRTYTVLVTRAAAGVSGDATLSALLLSAGSLSPAFSAGTTRYTASLSNTVSTLTVTPTASASGATVRVNGSTVASGSASTAIALAVGSNSLDIVVTAEDGSTSLSYTVLATRAAAGSCTITATETQGPYPLLAILSNTAMVRSDIRDSKTGVPLTVTLTLLDSSEGCAPVVGAAVYIWHCDKDGLYSGYSVANNAGQAGLSYLRGLQVTDGNGQVTFTTIYPGWYAGRITHITTAEVYASPLYTKGQNTSVTSFAADNVFNDGTSTELVAISGSVAGGYASSLTITIV